jgi:hypothetical protein
MRRWRSQWCDGRCRPGGFSRARTGCHSRSSSSHWSARTASNRSRFRSLSKHFTRNGVSAHRRDARSVEPNVGPNGTPTSSNRTSRPPRSSGKRASAITAVSTVPVAPVAPPVPTAPASPIPPSVPLADATPKCPFLPATVVPSFAANASTPAGAGNGPFAQPRDEPLWGRPALPFGLSRRLSGPLLPATRDGSSSAHGRHPDSTYPADAPPGTSIFVRFGLATLGGSGPRWFPDPSASSE